MATSKGRASATRERCPRSGPPAPGKLQTLRAARGRPGQRAPGRVLLQLRELFRLSQRDLRRVVPRGGLSGAQLWAMAELDARPGLKISELASALSVRLSTASNLLDRLQARALIRRERGEDDQRVVRVRLTTAGRGVLRATPPPGARMIRAALDRLPEGTFGELSRGLTALLKVAGPYRPRRSRSAQSPSARESRPASALPVRWRR